MRSAKVLSCIHNVPGFTAHAATRIYCQRNPSMSTRATLSQGMHKPGADNREYRAIKLSNGARFVVVQDTEAVFAAAAVNVAAGYMDDPASVPGLAHFLEHAVHLGSELYPEEGQYKAYLALHGGASNASTGMNHTVYHCTVAHQALQGALSQLSQFFISPLIRPEAVAREVENVHSEYSRNCNSDARKILQVRRSLCRGPYSQFSTGNITTLKEVPQEQGIDTAGLLRTFWDQHYTADRICGCVVGPQTLDILEGWVRAAFQDVRPGHGTNLSPGIPPHTQQHTPAAVAAQAGSDMCDIARPGAELGCMVRINPQRSAMRTLDMSWLIPYSSMRHWRVKPWQWVGHLLGHEGPGSLAAALKQQGMCTSLEVGTGDQMRAEPGFMWWGVSLELTQQGLQHVQQIMVAVHHALAMINALPDQDRARIYKEAAQVSRLRWEYADRSEPRDLARELSLRSHYWEPDQLLAGPALLQEYDGPAIDEFLSHLVPDRLVAVLVAEGAAGANPLKEQWYGGRYITHTLDKELVAACAQALHSSPAAAALQGGQACPQINIPPLSAEINSSQVAEVAAGTAPPARDTRGSALVLPALRPPDANWALPVDTQLVSGHQGAAGTGLDPASHTQPAEPHSNGSSSSSPEPTLGPSPVVVVDTPSLKMWHQTDTLWNIPKAHLHLHLITPAVYRSPTSWVTARLLIRLLQDLLQPEVYSAELLGTSYDIGCTETGLSLHLQGFSSVLPQLLRHVLEGLNKLAVDEEHVTARYGVMAGRLTQHLQLWPHNNPIQHVEYAVDHLLQGTHWHVNDSLAALLLDPARLAAAQTAQSVAPGGDGTDHMSDTGPDSSQAAAPGDAELCLSCSALYRPEVGPRAVCDMARSLKSQLFVEALCYGNLSADQARDVVHMVQQLLQPAGLPADQWPAVNILRLSPPATAGSTTVTAPGSSAAADPSSSGVDVRHVVVNPNPTNTNSALVYICQVCDTHQPGSAALEVAVELLVQMSSKRCFHALRTTQRLGYLVSLSEHRMSGVVGVQVRIQSPNQVPEVLRARVQQWLRDYRQELAGVSDEQLAGFKASLHSKLAQPPKSLSQASARCWHHIRTRTYDFQRRADKIAALQAITLPDLLAFYHQYMLPPVACTGSGGEHQEEDHGVGPGRVLSCEVWGGTQSLVQEIAPPLHPAAVLLKADQVAAFKASQPVYPARPAVQL